MRSRERSPHERSSRDSNREERGDLKENKPENVQDRHHLYLPHLVPREVERPPASQAEVLKMHNDRILLQTEICLVEVNARMPGVAPIIPPVSTVGNPPATVSWTEG